MKKLLLLLTLLSTLCIIIPFNKVSFGMNLSLRGLIDNSCYVFDNFKRSNRLLNGDISPTGRVWNLTGPGYNTTAIVSNRYVAIDNTYAYLTCGADKTLTSVQGSFSFVPGGGINNPANTVLTLIADSQFSPSPLTTMLHLQISPSRWSLQKRISSGPFIDIGSGLWTLATDGTIYTLKMSIGTSTVTITLPSGGTIEIMDSDIAVIGPKFGCWQITCDPDGYTGRWENVQIFSNISHNEFSMA